MRNILKLVALVVALIAVSLLLNNKGEKRVDEQEEYFFGNQDLKDYADTIMLKSILGDEWVLYLSFHLDDSEQSDYMWENDGDTIGFLPTYMLAVENPNNHYLLIDIIKTLRTYYCLEPYEHTRKVCLEYMYDERFPDDKYVMMQRRAYERWHNGIFNTDMGKIKYYTELDRLRLHLCVSGDTIGLDKLRQHYNRIGHPTRIIPYYMLLVDRYGREEYRKALHDSLVSAERVAAGCRELAKRYE